MRLPVFVSVPTALSATQQAMRVLVNQILEEYGLEPHTLTPASPSVQFPLKDIYAIARHCSGGLVLGFEQLRVTTGVSKPGTIAERPMTNLSVPTPWNQIEAGILFGLGLPLLIFREPNVSGGVFDPGATDAYIHTLPDGTGDPGPVRAVIQQWRAMVQQHYFRDLR